MYFTSLMITNETQYQNVKIDDYVSFISYQVYCELYVVCIIFVSNNVSSMCGICYIIRNIFLSVYL